MIRSGRIIIVALSAVALASGAGVAGVKVGQRSGDAKHNVDALSREVDSLTQRLAALEPLRSDLAGSKASLNGLRTEVGNLQLAVSSDGHTVRVTGEAYLPSAPDRLLASFRVEATRSTAGAVISRVESLAEGVSSALTKAGTSPSDVRTVWGTTYQAYSPTPSGPFTGFANVLVTVREPSRLDRLVRAAKAVGAGVSLQYVAVSDQSDSSALSQARTEALNEAREKAALYAKAAGRKLGRIANLAEQLAPKTSPAPPDAGDNPYYGYNQQQPFVVIVEVTYELA